MAHELKILHFPKYFTDEQELKKKRKKKMLRWLLNNITMNLCLLQYCQSHPHQYKMTTPAKLLQKLLFPC